MNRREMKESLKGALSLNGHNDALSDRVRNTLVSTLYTQPTTLAIGAINGIVSSCIVAWLSGEPLLITTAGALTVIAVLRLLLAWRASPSAEGSNLTRLEVAYEIGAFSYALMLGLTASLTIYLEIDAPLEVLMIANACGYGVGICARNAGRPAIAIGQLLLTCVPMMVFSAAVGTLPYLLFAFTLGLLIPAMAAITLNVFKVLRDSIATAERSQALADRMRTLARTDAVTGLANRAGLNHDMVERMMALEESQTLALFWLDLDRFKEVNDLLGHPVGDRVLTEIALRLLEVAPEGATICRFGGDEFIVLCEVADRAEGVRLASEMHAEVMRPVRIDGERLEVGVSIGVAMLPEDAHDAATLMQNADLALYHAKVNGRKQTQFYNPSMSRELAHRREIEAELRSAISNEELSIFFQPIVDLETGRIRSFEALVRWFHPTKGELPPDEFIPVAEETGVIVTLGNWITARAAKAAAMWPEDVTLAVNLSPLQIKAPGAALGILNALREARLPPERLELEVTETLFVDDHSATASFIEELSQSGVRFAMDDFGTGYSSLAYIQKFPFTKIKVDRSFVSGPDVGRKTNAIIRAVTELGSALGMDIVAEGLETAEQIENVRKAGCTLGQGYYFSRPVPDYLAAMLLAQERAQDGTPITLAG